MAKKNHVAIETTGFLGGTPERISPLGDKPRIRGAQQKNLPHGRFFVVRPSGFEPLAYRVGVCHSIQLSYGRIFSRSYYSKVRPKSKAGFSVSIRCAGHPLYTGANAQSQTAQTAACVRFESGAFVSQVPRLQSRNLSDTIKIGIGACTKPIRLREGSHADCRSGRH